MNINQLSTEYEVRELCDADADMVLALCGSNPMYYQHCPPKATRETILADMKALPPHTTYADKHYIGWFKGEKLVAVMDLIFNYPNSKTAFVGFFMVDAGFQGSGVGSCVFAECAEHLKSIGYECVRLGFVKGNRQSESFWRKNGFLPTGIDVDNTDYTIVVMEKAI